MERTGIIIKHFYSTTDVHTNSLTQRRQNRTTAEENKDIEISLVRRHQVRKNLDQVVVRVGRPTGGEMQESVQSGKSCVRMPC